jgi:hypothetical protein
VARSKLSGLWLIVFGVWAASAAAEVVRIEVDARSDVAGGMAYGKSGPYEKLRGTLYFAVDPKAAANRKVTDLGLAPRLERDQAVNLGIGRAQRGHVGHSHSSEQGLRSAQGRLGGDSLQDPALA